MTTYNIQWQSRRDGAPIETPINGKHNISLPQNTTNNTTDLILTGRGLPNYGEIQQENFIRLLENFASRHAPTNPTIGQIWFDVNQNTIKVYSNNPSVPNAQYWATVGQAAIGPTAPVNAQLGSLWWNNNENILYVSIGQNNHYPRYHPDGTGQWAQLWPIPEIAAGMAEYNTLANRINRIIGAPSFDTNGPMPDPADNNWGWGQTDLVPIFLSVNTCQYPGGPVINRPFDNNAWTILLSRLRKVALHTMAVELPNIPHVGFIRDGRGHNAEMLGHSNSSSNPLVYQSGWNNAGMVTIVSNWANVNNALNTIESSRFRLNLDVAEAQTVASAVRNTAWASTISHMITITFTSVNHIRSFFNAGGFFRFSASLHSGSGPLTQSWENFLFNTINNRIIFDYKGIRYVDPMTDIEQYRNAPLLNHSIGFYDLISSSPFQEVFFENRQQATYYTSADGGYRIEARYNNTTFQIEFIIRFEETDDGINQVSGILASSIIAIKPSEINCNAPEIVFPTAISTSIS